MEVTGVVLGGIPLVIWALENYRKALDPAKDYWRYDATLQTIETNMFIQKEQLEVTLSNAGLPQGATLEVIEQELRRRTPEKCDKFVQIIKNMEGIVEKILDKLEVDSHGKVSPSSLLQTDFIKMSLMAVIC